MLHAPRRSHRETKQGTYNEYTYTPEERVKMGRYGAENGPSKVTKHFSLPLDGKQRCTYVVVVT